MSTPDPTDTPRQPAPNPELARMLNERGMTIADFVALTNDVTLTPIERSAVELGVACGARAAIELLVGEVA